MSHSGGDSRGWSRASVGQLPTHQVLDVPARELEPPDAVANLGERVVRRIGDELVLGLDLADVLADSLGLLHGVLDTAGDRVAYVGARLVYYLSTTCLLVV